MNAELINRKATPDSPTAMKTKIKLMLPSEKASAVVPKNNAVEVSPRVKVDLHFLNFTEFQFANGIDIPNRNGNK